MLKSEVVTGSTLNRALFALHVLYYKKSHPVRCGLSSKILRPLVELTHASSTIFNSEMRTRLCVTRGAEIGQLFTTQPSQLRQLRHRVEAIRKTVLYNQCWFTAK